MRSVPPPLPARRAPTLARPTPPPPAPLPANPTRLVPFVLRGVAIVGLALVSIGLGAFALPGTRRAATPGDGLPGCPVFADPGDPTGGDSPPGSSVPGTPVVARLAADGTPIGDDVPPGKNEVRRVATPFDLPQVTPRLPSTRGPFAVARRIDDHVDRTLAEKRIAPSPVSGDAEFVRRIHLDLIGKIPTRERTIAFLNDTDPMKRARLIDELLASPEYGKHLARLWADALIKRDFDTNRGLATGRFEAWLASRFNYDAGWDQIVREMITAEGAEGEVAQTFFVLANMDNRQPSPSKLVGTVGNLFMGVQIQCAECHKHPFNEKWGVDDFWGMAAFFSHTKAQRATAGKNKKMTGPSTITEVEKAAAPKNKKGAKTGPAIKPGLVINVPDPNDPRKVLRTAKGRFFESPRPETGGKAPYRPLLAKWLTSKENRYFAQAAVNRTWAHFFARGLVNPVEDMSDLNKPTHPELLRELAAAFVGAKYGMKDLIRAICNSSAYQRTSRPAGENAGDDRYYSHVAVKVLDARQLLASLGVATGREMKGGRELPMGKRGVRDAGDQLVRYLDTRDYDDDPAEFSYGIPQMLRLMNTPLTAASAEKARQLASKHGNRGEAILEDVYLTALSRRPTAAEVQRMLAHVNKQTDPVKGYAGVFWALLNSAEFISNH